MTPERDMVKKIERWVPEGSVEFKPEIGEYPKGMFQCFVNVAKLRAIFYTGKQSKHTWYYTFHTEQDMKATITKTISGIMTREDQKAQRRESRKAPHSLEAGNILYSSWGYDQTNISFYQVTKVISDKTVELREISSKRLSSSDYGTDEVVAVKDAFLTPRGEYDKRGMPMIKMPRPDNTIKISSYEWAHLWNGQPKQETSLGWGH